MPAAVLADLLLERGGGLLAGRSGPTPRGYLRLSYATPSTTSAARWRAFETSGRDVPRMSRLRGRGRPWFTAALPCVGGVGQRSQVDALQI